MSQKFKMIAKEDVINYAKLKQYITEEESLDVANKLSNEKLVEVMAKTTYDMLMSYEA
jgi:Fe-S-cluster formation regulator IscX/YfhJ